MKLNSLSKTIDNVLYAHKRLLKFRLTNEKPNTEFKHWVEEETKLREEQEQAVKELNKLGFYFDFKTLEVNILSKR